MSKFENMKQNDDTSIDLLEKELMDVLKKYDIDYFTTSTSFKPDKNEEASTNIDRYYHHKNLDPNKGLWGNGTILYVRNSDGKDYIIKFTEEAKEIPKGHINYKWKYKAKYTILEQFPKKNERSRNIPAKLKQELLIKQNNKCWLCNDSFNNKNTYEVDHIIEWSKGGLTEIDNLQALCKDSCHWIKTLALKKEKKMRETNDIDLEYNFIKVNYEDGNAFLKNLIKKIKRIHDI
jgi:hypothetical protein